MDEYNKILGIADSELVELSTDFKQHLHKRLMFGMSRWVCRYGSLGDGHENYTPAQKYYQAIHMLWTYGNAAKSTKVIAMRAQAALQRATRIWQPLRYVLGWFPGYSLWAQSCQDEAESTLLGHLASLEDTYRQMDEFNKVRLELQDYVETKYPGGIEEAERDNWIAVFEARMIKDQLPPTSKEQTANIPLPADLKAQLGFQYGRPDAIAALAVTDPVKCEQVKRLAFSSQSPSATEGKDGNTQSAQERLENNKSSS